MKISCTECRVSGQELEVYKIFMPLAVIVDVYDSSIASMVSVSPQCHKCTIVLHTLRCADRQTMVVYIIHVDTCDSRCTKDMLYLAIKTDHLTLPLILLTCSLTAPSAENMRMHMVTTEVPLYSKIWAPSYNSRTVKYRSYICGLPYQYMLPLQKYCKLMSFIYDVYLSKIASWVVSLSLVQVICCLLYSAGLGVRSLSSFLAPSRGFSMSCSKPLW